MVFKRVIIIQFQYLFGFEILSTIPQSLRFNLENISFQNELLTALATAVMAFSVFNGTLYGVALTM